MATVFGDFDMSEFWEMSSGDEDDCVDDPLTDEKIASVENALGYQLPKSYIEFMRYQNGGTPRKRAHRTRERTSWALDHIAIDTIYAIGSEKPRSLLGEYGTPFWIDEWDYPAIGIYIADCPSAGHDMVCLDYSQCGRDGEPRVVHVDQEFEFKITWLADDFESFVRGLEDESAFDDA